MIEGCYKNGSSGCLSCKLGYLEVRSSSEGTKKITECKKMPADSKLKECLKATRLDSKNPKCKICMDGKMPNEHGVCVEVESKIRNCAFYKESGICHQCKTGYVLETESGSCVLNVKIGCRNTQSGKCIKCSYGFS